MNGLGSNSHRMHLSLYNKRNMQNTGEINFPVNLLSDYLVIPNNLLLSLSLSLSHRRYWRNPSLKYSNVRARGSPRKPDRQGTSRCSPAWFPVSFCQVGKGRNKNILIHKTTVKFMQRELGKRSGKRPYVKSECIVVTTEMTSNLMEASMSGQHNPGNHRPGPTPTGGAKQGWFGEEENCWPVTSSKAGGDHSLWDD